MGAMLTEPPRTMPLVWEIDGSCCDRAGFHYLLVEVPLGSETWRWQTSWTAHLTNALHDAGWAEMQRRRERERTRLATG